jgi:hypothetical protein
MSELGQQAIPVPLAHFRFTPKADIDRYEYAPLGKYS